MGSALLLLLAVKVDVDLASMLLECAFTFLLFNYLVAVVWDLLARDVLCDLVSLCWHTIAPVGSFLRVSLLSLLAAATATATALHNRWLAGAAGFLFLGI